MRERNCLSRFCDKIYTKMLEQTDQGANLDTATLTAREFSDFFDDLLNDFGNERPEGLYAIKNSMVDRWAEFYK